MRILYISVLDWRAIFLQDADRTKSPTSLKVKDQRQIQSKMEFLRVSRDTS